MILENIKRINDVVTKKCIEVGRKPDEVQLIAVSKNNPVSSILEVAKTGQISFGENKAQELKEKFEELKSYNFNWHFIGHLQKNKVKYVIEPAKLIHSVESIGLAEEINKKAENIKKIQNVLIEVNVSNESTKMGITDYNEVWKLAEYIKSLKNLKLSGLMTMAPYTDDEEIIRNTFKGLRKISEEMNKNGYLLTELSMGMTNDYLIAIEEGATLLRIGTAIFGERIYL